MLKKRQIITEFSVKKGFLLWGLTLTGYFLFIINWVLTSNLTGSVANGNGWISEFFDKQPNKVITNSVSWSITAMRALGSIGAGYVLAKIGHKYSVILALCLLSFALPTVFFPNYALFITGRMVMAIGGTVLILYTQPIISAFFKNGKTRGKLSLINSCGFNFGTALPLIPFMIPSVATSFLDNWKLVSGLVAGLPIILLLVYVIFGVNFEQDSDSDSDQKTTKTNKISIWSVVKEKNTLKMIIFMGSWIVAVVIPILVISPSALYGSADHGHTLNAWENKLPIILFVVFFIVGYFTVGRINSTQADRRKWLSFWCFLGVITMLGGFLVYRYMENPTILGCILYSVSGIALWGSQGVGLNIPHEFSNNTPKKIGIIFAWAWGGGYLIYTLSEILMSSLVDVADGSYWPSIICYIIITTGSYVVPFFFIRTKKGSLREIFQKIPKK